MFSFPLRQGRKFQLLHRTTRLVGCYRFLHYTVHMTYVSLSLSLSLTTNHSVTSVGPSIYNDIHGRPETLFLLFHSPVFRLPRVHVVGQEPYHRPLLPLLRPVPYNPGLRLRGTYNPLFKVKHRTPDMVSQISFPHGTRSSKKSFY